ncbi:MAG: hypothetical protein HQL53_13640 [Magnetococcales bacterium]|nr:hypothetical protein [Magnetococcales bacterium]
MSVHLMTVPQLGVNDDVALLAAWLVNDGGRISQGDPVCELETSKAVVEVTAEQSGYVALLAEENDELKVSAPLLLIGSTPELAGEEKQRLQAAAEVSATGNHPSASAGDAKATAKAIRLAEKLGIEIAKVPLGAIGVIREKDVQAFHDEQISPNGVAISEPQPFQTDPHRIPTVILGTGNGAKTMKECLDLAGTHQVVAFIGLEDCGLSEKEGLPVHTRTQLPQLQSFGVVCAGVAITKGIERLADVRLLQSLNIEPLNVVHPQAFISPSAQLGAGCFVKAGALIETACRIGDAVLIDNTTTLPHDNTIGDGCHLAPGVTLGSSITIGPMTIVGIGVSIATGSRIGGNCILSVGSSITQDIPDNSVVEGVPGRIIGQRKPAGRP